MICPLCGQEYTSHPAISRTDGSDICPRCGYRQALEACRMFTEEQMDEILAAMDHASPPAK